MIIYSALVDDKEKYVNQAVYLIWSLTELAKVSKDNIVLHYTGTKVDSRLERLGVEIVPVDPYELPYPYCNKLKQFKPLLKRNFDNVVLLDCDTVVLKEPPTFTGVAAKPVNYSNPPLDTQISIFKKYNIPYQVTECDIDGYCVDGNINAGVVIIDKPTLGNISDMWYYYSLECMKSGIDRYVDQMSFAMAVNKSGVNFTKLTREWNFSIHPFMKEEFDCSPSIIHYNWFYNEHHELKRMRDGFTNANMVLDMINKKWINRV
jgi:hypothetical protein